MALWIELFGEFETACKKRTEDLIHRIHGYALWCWKSPSADVRTAVACAFYEHLPTNPALRADLPCRISRAAFTELRDIFQYHLSPEDAVAFEREFFEAKQKFLRDV